MTAAVAQSSSAPVVRERPLLFSGPMVRAILAGQKTQTRRMVTRLREFGPITEFDASTTRGYDWNFRNRRKLWNDISTARLFGCCPYGKAGDRLWVRETWGFDSSVRIDFRPVLGRHDMSGHDLRESLHYGASSAPKAVPRWRPSIHLPRWASRITLEITELRVQRLHDISEEDAIAEGVDAVSLRDMPRQGTLCRRDDFAQIWDLINGKGAWDRGPWVWAVSFRRVEPS